MSSVHGLVKRVALMQLNYDIIGSGPPLLLVHGWSGSSAYFGRNVKHLKERFSVITWDLRFHGNSGKPDCSGFHVARLAADMAELLNALKVQDVVAVGCSMVRSAHLHRLR
jgi:non-heme chloroperoxidase